MFSIQVAKAVLSSIVITRYNDKTYRVDDIAWDVNPGKPWNDAGETYAQYYKRKYDMDIKNMTQPLLVSRLKVRRNSDTCCDSLKYCVVCRINFQKQILAEVEKLGMTNHRAVGFWTLFYLSVVAFLLGHVVETGSE